jgi:hypothetical protein
MIHAYFDDSASILDSRVQSLQQLMIGAQFSISHTSCVHVTEPKEMSERYVRTSRTTRYVLLIGSSTVEEPRPSSPNGLKRRQSEEPEQETKRQRTSPGKSSPTATKVDEVVEEQEDRKLEHSNDQDSAPKAEQKPESRAVKRKAGVVDEKQRSKRLFGSLLGNLNQPGDRSSKKRQEIEARRKAELKRQDEERVEDKNRRLEQLAEHRKKVQAKVNEETVRGHTSLLTQPIWLTLLSCERGTRRF